MNTVISNISTTYERNKLLKFMNQLMQNAYNLHFDVKSFIYESLPPPFSQAVADYLGNDIDSRNIENLLEKCQALEDAIDNIPHVTTTVSRIPSMETINQLKNMIARPVIFEIVEDHKVLGGCIIQSEGTISNYTLNRYFEGGKYGF